MIPLRDNVPTRRFPIVCVCLIVINLLVFILDQIDMNTVTYLIRGQEVLVPMGGLSLRYAMIPAYVTGNIQIGRWSAPMATMSRAMTAKDGDKFEKVEIDA